MSVPTSAEPMADREIVVSRIIEGPRNLVFEAFTDIEHLSQWWGPKGGTLNTTAFEFKAGGAWDSTIQSPGGGAAYPNHVIWKEIVKPERIVWLYSMQKDDPNAVETILTLEERGATTEVTLRLVFGTKELREQAAKYNAADGAKQSLERLATAVESH